MKSLIERYVYDVTRRLPAEERAEVSKELKSNIYDMLPDNADEDEVKAVFYKLGPPAILAERYRQKPRYLISPGIYDEYVRVLKWVLPLVGVTVLVIGMLYGAIDAIKDDMVDLVYVISNTLTKGIAFGVSATIQALVWITIGFVIAERTSTRVSESKEQEWKIEDLPEVLPDDNKRIPLSDSIVELVVTVVFSVVAILMCNGKVPIAFILQNDDMQVRTLFNSRFLISCIPAIIVMALFGISECLAKIKDRRWTPLVCGTVIASSIVNMGLILYLINQPNLLSEEFITFIQNVDWSGLDLLNSIGGTGAITPIISTVISVVVVVCSLVNCCRAVYKTAKT